MIFFIFFGLSSRVTKNVSTEIASVVTEENFSIFYGEINKPRGIKLHQIERKSFQKNWFHLYHWLHYGKEKDTAFVIYIYKPWKVRYWLLLGKMMLSSQKDLETGRRL